MTDTSKDAVDRLVLAIIRSGNTTAANMLNALAVERDAANTRADAALDAALEDVAKDAHAFAAENQWHPSSVTKLVTRILALRDKPAQAEAVGRCKVPPGQTPLNDKLSHPLLDVFNEGSIARDRGTFSPYHGHSLEHLIPLSAAMELPEVRALVEAATALLVQVDGLIPIKHPQQKLERNKLRHAITALAAIKETKT